MPTKVITRVNAIGRRTKQEVYGRDLEFLNRVKEKFEWSHEDDLDEMLGETPPEPADFPSISLATGEQVDSRAIQPDIQTEREFILASNDNQHSVFAEPRGDFDTLPNAITTGAELKDSPGPVDDEHLNEELDAVAKSNDQEGAAVEVAGEEPNAETPVAMEPDKSDVGKEEPAQPEALGRGHRVRRKPRSFDPSACKDKRYTYPNGEEQKIYSQVKHSEFHLVSTPGELKRVNELNWSTVLKTNAANLSPRELRRVKHLHWNKILMTDNCF